MSTIPLLQTEHLSSFQFPIAVEETHDDTYLHSSDHLHNSPPTLIHLQKRRYSSVSVTGQSDISEDETTQDDSKLFNPLSTPPRRKFSILNSPQSAFPSPISPISGLISSPLSPRITNIVSPLQIAIQQSMTSNTSARDLHDLMLQILLEHEKLKKSNHDEIDSYRNQIEKTEKLLNEHVQENSQLKMTVTGLHKDVQFLRLQHEKYQVDYHHKILEMKNKLERKERDLSKLLTLSQRLERENIILHRIQELLCEKIDALVKQLEDKEVAVSYLEEIVKIMRMLVEEKNRESYDKAEHVYNCLNDLCHKLAILNGKEKNEHSNERVSNIKKDFDEGIHSLRDELKKELNDCVSTLYNRVHGDGLDALHCEKKVKFIQTKLEELKIQSEEQERVLHQANERLISELGKKMEEISSLQLGYSTTNTEN